LLLRAFANFGGEIVYLAVMPPAQLPAVNGEAGRSRRPAFTDRARDAAITDRSCRTPVPNSNAGDLSVWVRPM
jgi:hypothetical protein